MDTDVQQLVLVKEEAPGEDQQDPEHLHMKEEQDELWTSLEGDQLHLKEETDAARFPVTVVTIKSEDDEEKPLISQLHQQQLEDRDVPACSSAGGGAGTSRNPDLNPHEQTLGPSEAEVSGDDEEDDGVSVGSELSHAGSETGDDDWNERRSSESDERPQHDVWQKENILTDQLSNQETTSSLDQREPEPPLIKEEQQEICIHQHKGQLILKQENVSFMVTSPSEETDGCEPEPNRNQPLCQSSTEAENQVQDGCRNENSEPNSNEELRQNKRRRQTKDHRDSQKLKRQKRAHRDERLFSCLFCGKSFTRKYVLTDHMRNHTGEKPFICESCGKCFTNSSNLTKHMRIHTGEKPFRCGTCYKHFSQNSNLRTHMKTHTGEKSFRCKCCGKCFSQSNDLTRHMRTHTGEKPYPCKTCGKCFSRSNHLTRHMKIHHR
nr:zinc finger protein 724 isoform X1 [Nothobranchius furzeri]XP_054593576.1 zinc finger protein 724 isoform X1 [Nothobranchius furzeri]